MRFFWALCVLCGLGSSAVAIDREAFTFTKYDLEIRLEPEQQRLGARGKITLRNDSALPQKIAVLQISSSLAWRSIKVEGKGVQFVSQPYASDIDHTSALSEAIVTLPAEIKPKESVELEIGYEGTIVQDGTRLTQIGIPEDIAKHSSWDQISPTFTAVRGAGYVAWYPIATGIRSAQRLRQYGARGMLRGIRLRPSRRISRKATACFRWRTGGGRAKRRVSFEQEF